MAVPDAAHLAGDLLGGAADEHLAKDLRRAGLRRDTDAAPVPGQIAAAEHQRSETGFAAEPRGDFLIERDRVANVGPAADPFGRDAGEERDFDVVPARIAAMRHAGEDGELLLVRVEQLRIAAMAIVAPGRFGEEVRRVKSERPADQDQAFGPRRRLAGRAPSPPETARRSIRQRREGRCGDRVGANAWPSPWGGVIIPPARLIASGHKPKRA